jgi:hypothetical protein
MIISIDHIVTPAVRFNIAIGACVSLFLPSTGFSQVPSLDSPNLGNLQGTFSSQPPSNSISHIVIRNQSIWIGTGKGLARSVGSGATWESFRIVPQFASRGIFSVAIHGDTVWASTGFSKDVDGSSIQTGTGYTFSTDNGATWNSRPQTLDGLNDSLVAYGSNTVRFLPIVVPEQNVTFDSAIDDSTVWIASWSSGIRRSTNLGETWQRVVLPSATRNSIDTSDQLGNYKIDPREDNNFLAFSVFLQDDSTVWAGTAGGINKSTNGGVSWAKYNTLNQQSSILGNWVIGIKGQQINDTTYRLWCTNWKADLDPGEEFGISYTDDGGRIWRNFLHGVRTYDFAFKDSIVYVASDEGVYRSVDGGNSWIRSGTIVDSRTGQMLTTSSFFAVGVIGDTVYCGTGGGLVRTMDNAANPFGQSWEIQRTYQPVGNTSATYAYPNPFSPDDEYVRLHYSTAGAAASVSVEIFDFGMNRVRTVIRNAQRSGAFEHDELWDGKDDAQRQVSNGVYFYRVIVNDGEPSWGKVMVLQ